MGDDEKEKTGKPNKGEREFEIGMDELWKFYLAMVASNVKRTFDEYQDLSLTAARANQTYIQKVLSDAQQSDNERQKIANLALSNAVTNSDAIAKQMIRHADLAIDRQWNVDEVSALTAKTGLEQDIVAASAAAAVAAVLAAMASQQKQSS
jgi:hypothetical protein